MNSSFAFGVAQSQKQSNTALLGTSARSVFCKWIGTTAFKMTSRKYKRRCMTRVLSLLVHSVSAQQTSSAIELHSVTLPEVHLVRPTKRAAGHSATSQPKRLRLTSSSPGRVTVCLFA